MDDELDIELRPTSEVAARCIILAALTRRLVLESLAVEMNAEELDGEAFDLRAWLQTEGFWDHVTPGERDFLDNAVGHHDRDEIARMSWQSEGLAAIGWCLALIDQLPVGKSPPIEELMQTVPGPWQQTLTWIRHARLRTEAEIVRQRERAEIEEWRISVEAQRRAATEQDRIDLAALIAQVVQEARDAGMTDGFAQDEFLFDGVLVSDVAERDLDRLFILSRERLRALNWVCGFGSSWDRVPLEV